MVLNNTELDPVLIKKDGQLEQLLLDIQHSLDNEEVRIDNIAVINPFSGTLVTLQFAMTHTNMGIGDRTKYGAPEYFPLTFFQKELPPEMVKRFLDYANFAAGNTGKEIREDFYKVAQRVHSLARRSRLTGPTSLGETLEPLIDFHPWKVCGGYAKAKNCLTAIKDIEGAMEGDYGIIGRVLGRKGLAALHARVNELSGALDVLGHDYRILNAEKRQEAELAREG